MHSGKNGFKIRNKLINKSTKPYILFVGTACILLIYLLFFQFNFTTSGDSWAEAYYEYVHGAITNGAQGFFHIGIAGYFNFLPKLFIYPYVIVGLPLAHVDYLLRFITIAYAVMCISYIAHTSNRYIIKNDSLRVLFSLLALMLFYHISSFSFINVWYVGFIPIILVSLNPNKFRNEFQQITYAAFAMSVCLTKPSLILIPLVVYRMVKLKEYLLGSIVLFSIALQTLLFFSSSYYLSQPNYGDFGLIHKFIEIHLYVGLIFLKLFKIFPISLPVLLFTTILIFSLFYFVIKSLGRARAATIYITVLLSSYAAIFSPDAPPVSVYKHYKDMYYDLMKLQREIIVAFFIILLIILSLDYIIRNKKLVKKYTNKRLTILASLFLLLICIFIYRPIDTISSGIYVNIDPFRDSLRARSIICMPIAPTPSWVPYKAVPSPVYGWFFESSAYGSCTKNNYEKTIDYSTFDKQIGSGVNIDIASDQNHHINSILIPVFSNNTQNKTMILKNNNTGLTHIATVRPSKDNLSFVAFNLSDEKPSTIYNYTLSEDNNTKSAFRVGEFKEGGLVNFSYFITNIP